MITLSTIRIGLVCCGTRNNGNERKRHGLDSITAGEKSYFLAVRSCLRKANRRRIDSIRLQIVRIRWEWLAQPFRSRTHVLLNTFGISISMESVCTIFLLLSLFLPFLPSKDNVHNLGFVTYSIKGISRRNFLYDHTFVRKKKEKEEETIIPFENFLFCFVEGYTGGWRRLICEQVPVSAP